MTASWMHYCTITLDSLIYPLADGFDTIQLEVSIDVGATALADGVFEAHVTVTLTATIKDKVAFLVEGKQAGIFEIRNIPEGHLDPLLGIGCPSILYPYLRANIADAITRAGFPPVHLAEINFETYYQQNRQAAVAGTPQEQAYNASGLVMPDGSAATIN